MKLKCYRGGILQKEEFLPNGWIARVSYRCGVNITNIDLSGFASTYEKTIEIRENSYLKIIINDAPFLNPIYDIMESYKGIQIVRFECDENLIVIEW